MTSPTNRTDEVKARKVAKKAVCDVLGFYTQHELFEVFTKALLSFSASAVEQERERCAKVAQLRYYDPSHMSPSAHHRIGLGIAADIRQTPTEDK